MRVTRTERDETTITDNYYIIDNKIEIDKLSKQINKVRKEVVLYKDIEERHSILKEKLEKYEFELQKEERKDMVK